MAKRLVVDPAWVAEQLAVRRAQPCGTYAASRRHYRRREPLCDPCRRAAADYWARRAAERRAPREDPVCGTYAAARRHRRRREPLDWACQEAERAASAVRRAARRARAQTAAEVAT